MNAAVERLLDALEAHGCKPKQAGPDQWTALCPAHEDRKPSLSVAEGDDCALVRCHAGCETEAVLAAVGLTIVVIYPLMKRFTHLPQIVLGVAFGWSIPMAFTAQMEALPVEAWLAFLANMFWTVAYDTQYAMSDRDDDLKVGIKSTAILFGKADRSMVALLQLLAILTLMLLGERIDAEPVFYVALAGACVLFAYQHVLIRHRSRDGCFRAFMNNNWVGMCVFIGIVLSFAWAADVVD